MKIIINPESHNILFKRVFGNKVYRQALLYHYKVAQISEFEFVGDDDVVNELLKYLNNDPAFNGANFKKSMTAESDSIPLNRLYYAGEYVDVINNKDIKQYKKLYAQKIRENTQTFVAKHINKRVSLPLSSVLAWQNMGPNNITLIAIIWSLVGALCLLTKDFYVLGFLCFQINSLLDGSDGEVARFNLSFSEFGKKLDVYCDYLTTILIIVFEAVGFYLLMPKQWVWVTGLLSVVALIMVGVISLVTQKKLKDSSLNDLEVMCHKKLKKPETLYDKIHAVFLFVSHRDFYILFIFVLALLNLFAFIHVFLCFLCFCWVLLAIYTFRISKLINETIKS